MLNSVLTVSSLHTELISLWCIEEESNYIYTYVNRFLFRFITQNGRDAHIGKENIDPLLNIFPFRSGFRVEIFQFI